MATKDFTAMSNKKLNALLQTANDEDRAAIQAVLAERGQVQVAEIEPEEPLTPEEEAALAEAEAAQAAKKPTGRPSTPKLSDEELEALNETCKANVGHKCQYVPFGTAEWHEGVIVGTIIERRSRKVLYAIQDEDGKRVVKVYNSPLVKILDEMVEMTVGKRIKTQEKRAAMTPEEAAAKVAEVSDNIGQTATFKRGEETIAGIISGVLCDKRTHCLMYLVRVNTTDENGTVTTKTIHVTVNNSDLTVSTERSEDGQRLYDKRQARKEKATTKPVADPAGRVAKCEENLKKAEAALEKARLNVENKMKALEAARHEYAEYLAAQESAAEESLD